MKKIISASRRTDLVSFFPKWLSSAIREERALVYGPSHHVYSVDLRPENVHTFVIWSKNLACLIDNRYGLKDALQKYDQLYFHFSITGLGGTFIESKVPSSSEALKQLEALVEISGGPERISVRFDPVVFWKESNNKKTNLYFFEELAPELSALGVKDVRFSFTQWYGKSQRRAEKYKFSYVDPEKEDKIEYTRYLRQIAKQWGLNLYACSQRFLCEIPGIQASSCIDGRLFQKLHPSREPVSLKKDKSQRKECGCTESVDIGSYTQRCPHSCLYCYANPGI